MGFQIFSKRNEKFAAKKKESIFQIIVVGTFGHGERPFPLTRFKPFLLILTIVLIKGIWVHKIVHHHSPAATSGQHKRISIVQTVTIKISKLLAKWGQVDKIGSLGRYLMY